MRTWTTIAHLGSLRKNSVTEIKGQLQESEGKVYLNLREWFAAPGDEPAATKKGVCFPVENASFLVDVGQKALKWLNEHDQGHNGRESAKCSPVRAGSGAKK